MLQGEVTTWLDPVWKGSAHLWIERQLSTLGITRTGEIEQPHVRVWSTVMRIPTDSGTVWFKANMDALRHEAAVAETLSEHQPDLVPPLLAVDRDRGWMLMPDAGETLRDVIARERSLDRWFDVLPRYARLQLDCASDVEGLLAEGVPDLRLPALPGRYQQLVEHVDVGDRFRDATAYVGELCEQLAAYGIAETIQHDDLHDAQVFVRDDRQQVMDWGDACISHPFCTLSVTLEGVIAWGLDDETNAVDVTPYRDAYLEPFTAEYGTDLSAATDIALRLGWACRAVNGHIPGDDDPTRARLRMFLDGHP
jgi:hypothetical protein